MLEMDHAQGKTKDETNEGLKVFEENNESRLGKIRKHVYFIIARAIKFGIDTKFFVEDCQLVNKLIKDLSRQNNNDFIFSNVLMVVENFNSRNLDPESIASLIRDNQEELLDLVYNITDQEKRNGLLKVITNLILDASEQLASNSELFEKFFHIAKDARSDILMIENILWFASSLCDQWKTN